MDLAVYQDLLKTKNEEVIVTAYHKSDCINKKIPSCTQTFNWYNFLCTENLSPQHLSQKGCEGLVLNGTQTFCESISFDNELCKTFPGAPTTTTTTLATTSVASEDSKLIVFLAIAGFAVFLLLVGLVVCLVFKQKKKKKKTPTANSQITNRTSSKTSSKTEKSTTTTGKSTTTSKA
ncbi:unnamed protein product [Caenorhabditis sp. 36 PRJEB53466]|nr:unnamed protein product [Caenorhabditis sp. 36 PRJEB53466]